MHPFIESYEDSFEESPMLVSQISKYREQIHQLPPDMAQNQSM